MAAPERDLTWMNHLSRDLNHEENTSVIILEEIYSEIFDDDRNRARTLQDVNQWNAQTIDRAIDFLKRIVPRYAQLYQDPHAIPVTHYQRQKKLAIHLDQQFSKILWEKVRRADVPGLLENGLPVKDAFLDSPVLFMKEDARTKRFPKNKKGAIVNLQLLIDRFEEKLLAKGIHLESAESKEDRFTYGP
jgi:hypothetical protein